MPLMHVAAGRQTILPLLRRTALPLASQLSHAAARRDSASKGGSPSASRRPRGHVGRVSSGVSRDEWDGFRFQMRLPSLHESQPPPAPQGPSPQQQAADRGFGMAEARRGHDERHSRREAQAQGETGAADVSQLDAIKQQLIQRAAETGQFETQEDFHAWSEAVRAQQLEPSLIEALQQEVGMLRSPAANSEAELGFLTPPETSLMSLVKGLEKSVAADHGRGGPQAAARTELLRRLTSLQKEYGLDTEKTNEQRQEEEQKREAERALYTDEINLKNPYFTADEYRTLTWQNKSWRTVEVETKRIVNMTRGGKRARQSSLVIIGNGVGGFGYGMAQSLDRRRAVEKATNRAHRNIIPVPFSPERTVYQAVEARFRRNVIHIEPAPPGTGLLCHPIIAQICEAVGIENIKARVRGPRNYKSIMHALIKAFSMMKRPEEIAEELGVNMIEFRHPEDKPILHPVSARTGLLEDPQTQRSRTLLWISQFPLQVSLESMRLASKICQTDNSEAVIELLAEAGFYDQAAEASTEPHYEDDQEDNASRQLRHAILRWWSRRPSYAKEHLRGTVIEPRLFEKMEEKRSQRRI